MIVRDVVKTYLVDTMRATYKNTEDICDLIGREVRYTIDETIVKVIGVSEGKESTMIQAVCEEDGAIFEDEIHSFRLMEEEHECNC